MFAIIQTGGKQIKVSKGDEIFIEKINNKENEIIKFDNILMINNEIGTPFLKNAYVIGKILKHGKQKKIIVFKYKPKKNIHKKYGHRQQYSKIKIEDIIIN